jgi:hypothetical protein
MARASALAVWLGFWPIERVSRTLQCVHYLRSYYARGERPARLGGYPHPLPAECRWEPRNGPSRSLAGRP